MKRGENMEFLKLNIQRFASDGKVVIETELKTNGIETGVKKVKNSLNGFDSSFKGLTNVLKEQESRLAKLKEEYINTASQLGKNSQKAQELKAQYEKLSKEFESGKSSAQKLEKELDDISKTKAHTGVDKLNSSLSKMSSIAKTGFKAVATSVGVVSSAMTGLIGFGVKYNAEIEQLQTSFEVMTGSAEKAKDIIAELQEIGAKTPFEVKGLAETTQLLMNYGLEADDAIDKMMMLGDIAQGSSEKMNRIAMAYGQMSSAGKVQLEDIKQMIDFCHAM